MRGRHGEQDDKYGGPGTADDGGRWRTGTGDSTEDKYEDGCRVPAMVQRTSMRMDTGSVRGTGMRGGTLDTGDE
jgi:hypothetical protein